MKLKLKRNIYIDIYISKYTYAYIYNINLSSVINYAQSLYYIHLYFYRFYSINFDTIRADIITEIFPKVSAGAHINAVTDVPTTCQGNCQWRLNGLSHSLTEATEDSRSAQWLVARMNSSNSRQKKNCKAFCCVSSHGIRLLPDNKWIIYDSYLLSYSAPAIHTNLYL